MEKGKHGNVMNMAEKVFKGSADERVKWLIKSRAMSRKSVLNAKSKYACKQIDGTYPS